MDAGDDALRRMAATELGMLARVLAAESDPSAEGPTELALEESEDVALQP